MASVTTPVPAAPAVEHHTLRTVVVSVVLAVAATLAVVSIDLPSAPAPPAPVSQETAEHAAAVAVAASELGGIEQLVRVSPAVAPAMEERRTTLRLVVTGQLPVEAAAAAPTVSAEDRATRDAVARGVVPAATLGQEQ